MHVLTPVTLLTSPVSAQTASSGGPAGRQPSSHVAAAFSSTSLRAVRTAKFVARKQWIACGADDMFVRVYNYNTMDKVKAFEAHTDYIRSITVHPTLPYLLTSSDDMLIKLWDWDKVGGL